MADQKNTEFETKVLEFDAEVVIQKLREAGAEEVPEYMARRYVFTYHDKFPEFIRLRDENGKITMAYKKKDITTTEMGKTVEIQTDVTDFDRTAEILKTLTFDKVIYIETKHHIFRLNGVEYSIDTWPIIPPILEIESSDIAKVNEGLEFLGLTDKAVGDKDMMFITEPYGFDVNDFSYFGFDHQEKFPVPSPT